MLTRVVYAIAAAQLMKMIYVSSAHQATNTADIDSASSLYHDYVSLHFYQYRPIPQDPKCWCGPAGLGRRRFDRSHRAAPSRAVESSGRVETSWSRGDEAALRRRVARV